MTVFPGYKHLEQIYDFEKSIIYRAQREKDNCPVIIKFFKTEITQKEQKSIKEQLSFLEEIDIPELIKSLDLNIIDNHGVFILKDAEDMFLSIIQRHQTFDMDRFLNVAVETARSLNKIHSSGIVLNKISPHQILINQNSGAVMFSGIFSEKMPINQDSHMRIDALVEDKYIYTSPEQTGTISWAKDHRGDLYSLGAIFYELLSGTPPFVSDDPNEIIHSQLALEPTSLYSLRPTIPWMMSQIISKLLSKSPDDRYQSALGLLKDLENCQTQYQTNRWIEPFELAIQDNIERFQLPTRLYGAEKNMITLFESFSRVRTGSVEMIIIKGKGGTGKTTLVNELSGLIKQKGGFLATGRCDRQYRDTPYYPLIRAFQDIVNGIIREGEKSVKKWRTKFQETFARNGQMVIDFIPEMETIIGKQPPIPKLDPDESRNRLNYIFKRFFQVFTNESIPLVMFIDSFHWADSESIQLIQASLSDVNSRYLMLIITQQEELVIHSHTQAVALDEILLSGIPIQTISVTPLTAPDIELLIEEALYFKQNFKELATFIHEKTLGNPYFAKQLLQTLYEEQLIQFDRDDGRWNWEIEAIKQAALPDKIDDLLVYKINKLPQAARRILKLASCVGNQFDLELLALASKQNHDQVTELVQVCQQHGFIEFESSKESKESEPPEAHIAKHQTTKFRFSHSRVLRAAYSMLSLEERKSTHLMLGRVLKENTPDNQLEQNAYHIINQMNEGTDLLQNDDERVELAQLNLIAGKLSKSAAAFETAWKFFKKGSDLLNEKSWTSHYELSKDLLIKRAECEYYIGNTKELEPVFDLLLSHLKTIREKVEVFNLKINLYIKNDEPEKAVHIGLDAMSDLFNEKIPPNDAEITIVSQIKMQDIQTEMELRNVKNLIYLPKMADKDKISLIELITNILPAAYIARKNLWVFLTLKIVELSLRHGNSDQSAFGYMNYAVILCSGMQEYNAGFGIGKLALDLNQKINNHQLISQLNLLFGCYINHWNENARENITYLKKAYQAGIDYGDFISAGNSVDYLVKTHIFTGSPLEELQRELKKHQDFIDELDNQELKLSLETSELILSLRNSQKKGTTSAFDTESLEKLSRKIKQTESATLGQWFYLVIAQLRYYAYQNDTAMEAILKSDTMVKSYSQLAVPEHYYFYSLIVFENYNGFNDEAKKKYWDILKTNQDKLREFAENCPVNYRPKSLLIEALMTSLTGNYIKTTDLFDEAIRTAKENGYSHTEGLANELTAKYYLERGKRTIATAYLREACHAYTRWGATAKLDHIQKTYSSLLVKRQRQTDQKRPVTSRQKISSINLESIIKSSQTISKEIILEKVIEKLIQILLVITNAQKVIYLKEDNGQLRVIAEGSLERTSQFKSVDIPLEKYHNIAQSIIFYVIRTRKTMAVDNAPKNEMFAYDDYIISQAPKSILCVPVLSHGELTGIVYLENKKLAGAFTPKEEELIQLLVSQVSISIENSLLYSSLSELTEQLGSSKMKLEKRIKVLEEQLASHLF